MKRGAENQLTKDSLDDEDDEIEEIQDPQGFQQADESVLAKRQIRGLPKRAFVTSKLPPLNGLPPAPIQTVEKDEAVPTPKFGGFSGFGAATTAFTFSAPTIPAATPDTAFKPPKPIAPLFLGAHAPSPMDTDASPSKPATPSPTEETDAVAFKYFKSLRGLNVSFLSAISTAVEKDPFCDVANLVESYKNLRTTIQSEFDTSSQPSANRDSTAPDTTSLFGAKAPLEKTSLFSMPKQPAGSAGTSPKLPATSESGTKTGGFTFPPFVPPSSSAPTPSPFGLASKPSGASSSTTPEPPKSAFAFKSSTSTSSMPPPPGFSLGAPTSVENATTKSAPSPTQDTEGSSTTPSQPASTAPNFGSSNVPNFFATKSTNVFGSDPTLKPTSIFGNSIFGGTGTSESNKPSLFAPPLPDGKDTPKANTTLFGNPATSSSTTSSIFGSSDKPTTSFGSASPSKSTPFTFGKPGGSIGNPVGFGFGGSAPSAGDVAIPGSSGSAFTFGVSSAKPSESLFSPPSTDKSTESTPQPDAEGNEEGGEEDTAKLLPMHTHDEEGEGEEEEETMHVVKCKVFRLSKSGDKSEWRDLGVGMFRLKKHKVTSARRALMRNSNTGRILINFRIYTSLKLSLAKTSISFIGYEDSAPASFRIRVKTEEQAEKLKQAMEREIAASQATD